MFAIVVIVVFVVVNQVNKNACLYNFGFSFSAINSSTYCTCLLVAFENSQGKEYHGASFQASVHSGLCRTYW
jgi:hypothetical protein